MARRTLGEGKSVRLQLVISPQDLAEIKSWQHTNKIQSLSETIRHLVFEGIWRIENARKAMRSAGF